MSKTIPVYDSEPDNVKKGMAIVLVILVVLLVVAFCVVEYKLYKDSVDDEAVQRQAYWHCQPLHTDPVAELKCYQEQVEQIQDDRFIVKRVTELDRKYGDVK